MQVQPLLVRQQSFARLSSNDMSSVFSITDLHAVGVETGPYDIGPRTEVSLHQALET